MFSAFGGCLLSLHENLWLIPKSGRIYKEKSLLNNARFTNLFLTTLIRINVGFIPFRDMNNFTCKRAVEYLPVAVS